MSEPEAFATLTKAEAEVVTTPEKLYLVVVAKNTNPMLPHWKVGTPVFRARGGMGGPTFKVETGYLDTYVDGSEAELEIVARGSHFMGVTFEVKTYILAETIK